MNLKKAVPAAKTPSTPGKTKHFGAMAMRLMADRHSGRDLLELLGVLAVQTRF